MKTTYAAYGYNVVMFEGPGLQISVTTPGQYAADYTALTSFISVSPRERGSFYGVDVLCYEGFDHHTLAGQITQYTQCTGQDNADASGWPNTQEGFCPGPTASHSKLRPGVCLAAHRYGDGRVKRPSASSLCGGRCTSYLSLFQEFKCCDNP